MNSRFTSQIRVFGIVFLLYSIILSPLLPLVQDVVLAAQPATEGATFNVQCPNTAATNNYDNSDNEEVDSTEQNGSYAIDFSTAKQDPMFDIDRFNEAVKEGFGKEDSKNPGLWYFCIDKGLNEMFSAIPITTGSDQYLAALSLNSGSVEFKNPLDYYALTGEPCRKMVGDVCDESTTTIQTPVLDKEGNPTLDTNGKAVTTSTTSSNFDDIAWKNGHWDAPKADVRILKTLVYLTTPVEYGGAGREFIQVGKILQDTKKNTEFAVDPENPDQQSSHAYDAVNYSSPSKIAQALEITAIDTLRVTTRITKKRRLGGNSVSYKYRSFPIKVAWQTQEGQEQTGVPPVDIYSGAKTSWNQALLSMLDNVDLGGISIDPSKVDLNNLGSVADLVGNSLVSSLLQNPNSAVLNGSDPASVLENFGRAYLEKQLGLASGSLDLQDSNDDVIENIGRVTTENLLSLPKGSLRGDTSYDILRNLGQRYLEETVFNVTPGSLISSSSYPITNHTQLLTALGIGRIEKVYGLAPQSLRGENSLKDIQNSSLKASLIFQKNNYTSDSVDEKLSLIFNPVNGTDKNSDGFTGQDFVTPTARLTTTTLDPSSYYRLVGSRVVESTVGIYNPNTITAEGNKSISPNSCSYTAICTNPLLTNNEIADSNFIDKFLDLFTVNIAHNSGLNTTLFPVIGHIGNQIITNPSGKGKPDGSDIIPPLINGGIASTYGQNMIKTGAISEANLRDMLNRLLADQLSGHYNLISQPAGVSYADYLQTIKKDAVNWQKYVSTIVGDPLAVALLNPLDKLSADPSKQSASDIHDSMLTVLATYINSLDNQQQSGSGETAASTALNLHSLYYAVNSDGTPTTTVISDKDPIATILNGDLSGLGLIGTALSAKIISNNESDQRTFVGAVGTIKTDLAPSFNFLRNLGLSATKLEDQGLKSEDFERIFINNEADQVFSRIGKDELLRTAWNRLDIASSINQVVSGNKTSQRITQTVAKVTQTVDFYTDRIGKIDDIADFLYTKVDEKNKAAIQKIRGTNKKSAIAGIIGSEAKAKQYEIIFETVRKSSTDPQVQAKIKEAYQIIQEMLAGHPLEFTTTTTSNSVAPAQCWTQSDIQDIVLKKGAKTSAFKKLAITAAGCQIDASLGFPLGSMKNWYADGTTNSNRSERFSLDSLELAIGQAALPDSKDSAEQKATGIKILETRTATVLGNLIPGFSSLGITVSGESILALLSGNPGSIAKQIGTSAIDHYLNWEKGSALNLVDPTCTDPNDTAKPPQKVTCTSAQKNDIRLRTMAQIGLGQLGLDLNFPTSFGLASKGDFTSNYGNSYLSQSLGLTPNTFTGSFSTVSAANYAISDHLLSDFGILDSPYIQNLKALASELSNSIKDVAVRGQIINTITNNILDQQRSVLESIQKPTSPYWTPLPGVVPALGTKLSQEESRTYLAGLTESSNLSLDTASLKILDNYTQKITASYIIDNGKWYINTIVHFQAQVNNLDSQFNLNNAAFTQFIQGKVSADDIAKSVGNNQLIGKLADSALDTLIPEGPLRDALDGFKLFAQASGYCKGNMSTGQVMTAFLTNKSTGCQNGFSLSGKNLSDVFSKNDVANVKFRSFLYDHLLSTVFGDKLESDLGISSGTFRSMILDPRHAQEIAINEGLTRLADQLFQTKDPSKTSNYRSIFRNAFLAGFYDPSCHLDGIENNSCHSYTLNFNTERANKALTRGLNDFEDQEIGAISINYFGTSITRADLHGIVYGDVTTLYYLGSQFTAKNLNDQLGNDPKAQPFKVDYNTVRAAFSIRPEYSTEFKDATLNVKANYIRQKAFDNENIPGSPNECLYTLGGDCYDSINLESVQDADLVGYYEAHHNTPTTLDPGYELAPAFYENDIISAARKQAQANLQYKLYDIAAYKLDSNIPAGFSKAMLKGTSATKNQYLGLYALNLLKAPAIFGNSLTSAEILDLGTYAANGFQNGTGLTGAAIDKFDNWFTSHSGDLIGLPGLPSGIVTGFFAWGSTGFSGDSFDDTVTNGPFCNGKGSDGECNGVPSMGTVLKSYGVTKLLGWADKELGFPVGSTYQIYQSVQGLQAASSALKGLIVAQSEAVYFANQAGDELFKGAIQDFYKPKISGAKAQVNAATAALVTLIITTVFAKQLGQLETSLGLVPGTASIGVGILIGLAFGVVDPISIALFIGLNLFGYYATVIDIQANSDGFYPYDGPNKPYQHQSPDNPLGDFEAKNPDNYHTGLQAAAQQKVEGVLRDLLLMPTQWSAVTGDDPNKLWIPQVFFGLPKYAQDLDYLISRPAPYGTDNTGNTGWGYGSYNFRANSDSSPKAGVLSGFFSDKNFTNQIYISWGKS